MQSRRRFLKWAAAIGVSGAASAASVKAGANSSAAPVESDREYWVGALDRVAAPVLENLARRELRKNMPVEAANAADRAKYTHLEAFGRTLCGVAPWLGAQGLDPAETARRLERKSWHSPRWM